MYHYRRSLACTVVATLAVALSSPAALAQAPASASLTECAVEGKVRFFCGLDTPEDLVRVPGTHWLIASSLHGVGVHALNLHDRSIVQLVPWQVGAPRLDARRYPGCPGPLGAAELANFATHGLALRRTGRGRYVLYVVHHTGREAIEAFELEMRAAVPTATWLGCVVAPEGVNLNSVVALSDGGLIATNFIPGDQQVELPRVMSGQINGELWEWHAQGGWARVPGSQASGANGVEISSDGRWIYFNAWGSQTVVRLSRGLARPRRTEIQVGFRPDNVHWAPDGLLLEGGQTESGYRVVKIDPVTLHITQLLDRPNTPVFFRGSVAAQFGAQYWIGSSRAHALAVFYDAR